jgi:hypothetical protein
VVGVLCFCCCSIAKIGFIALIFVRWEEQSEIIVEFASTLEGYIGVAHDLIKLNSTNNDNSTSTNRDYKLAVEVFVRVLKGIKSSHLSPHHYHIIMCFKILIGVQKLCKLETRCPVKEDILYMVNTKIIVVDFTKILTTVTLQNISGMRFVVLVIFFFLKTCSIKCFFEMFCILPLKITKTKRKLKTGY